MKELTITDMEHDGKNRIFEIVGRTGSGKTTLAQMIALRYTESGKHVLFFQRKPEETALDVISHLLITANRSEYGEVTRTKKPDLIILDDFIIDPTNEEIYTKLCKHAEIHDCQFVITRQDSTDNVKIFVLESEAA